MRKWIWVVGVVVVAFAFVGAQEWMRASVTHHPIPDLGPLEPGQVHQGLGQYVEYTVGALPLVLSSPHGGSLTPGEIGDRTRGYFIGDSGTQELTRLVSEELATITGESPHVVISLLSRKKLDPNRDLDEAAQDPIAQQAWRDYHGYIDVAKQDVAKTWGSGLYIDMHGHGHRIPWVELGYVMTPKHLNGPDKKLNGHLKSSHTLRTLAGVTSASVAELLRGPTSLGGLLEARGYRSVPSPSDPGPGHADYFNGGYSTLRHGSYYGGPISSVQLEHPKRGVRDTDANRRVYARHLAEVLVEFTETHYGFKLPRASRTR